MIWPQKVYEVNSLAKTVVRGRACSDFSSSIAVSESMVSCFQR